MESAGVLVHVYRKQVSECFTQHLLPYFGMTLANIAEARDYNVQNALCFLCDVFSFGGEDIFNLASSKAAEKFTEVIINYLSDRSIIQSAAFGLGEIALRTPKGQFAQLEKSLKVSWSILLNGLASSDCDPGARQ